MSAITADQVKSDVAEYLQLDPSRLSQYALLTEDLGVDSLTAIEMSIQLEGRYDIDISDEELADVSTYGDLEKLVLSKTGEK
ncbi:acyl carrier protein [Antricoccus suffuscus]|uniref:Acyl carrier protein n=1 Tax=Antricoccus suffuscus TaxID=1629062 RepID=A0A2T0ZW16_9ACTN|nr:acyl carrier protein [Antricoccus suffuscus]PRZ40447.1 acyl carrier protein [Antricoccus suffuscus]